MQLSILQRARERQREREREGEREKERARDREKEREKEQELHRQIGNRYVVGRWNALIQSKAMAADPLVACLHVCSSSEDTWSQILAYPEKPAVLEASSIIRCTADRAPVTAIPVMLKVPQETK